MGHLDLPRRRPRIFNTPFETGLRSVVILTACYPERRACISSSCSIT